MVSWGLWVSRCLDWGTLTSSVEGHPARPGKLVFLDALLLNELLGHDITDAKEHRGRHSLGEQRACR